MFASQEYGTLFEVSDRITQFDQMEIRRMENPVHGFDTQVIARIRVVKPRANKYNLNREDIEELQYADIFHRTSGVFEEWYILFVRTAMLAFNRKLEELEHGSFVNRHHTPATIEVVEEMHVEPEHHRSIHKSLKKGDFYDSGFNEFGEFKESYA